jgi:hypothetical protein
MHAASAASQRQRNSHCQFAFANAIPGLAQRNE